MTIHCSAAGESDSHAHISDLELARAAARGDEAAAFAWVRRASPPLLRTATLILQDHHLAEDAVQETLVSALDALHQYDGRASFMSWLLAILANRCHSFRRSPRTRPWSSMEKNETTPDTADAINEKAKQDAMRQILMQLNVAYRTVIVLHYYEDLSVEEVARIVQRPVGTVKSQLHRARQRMRKLLAERGMVP